MVEEIQVVWSDVKENPPYVWIKDFIAPDSNHKKTTRVTVEEHKENSLSNRFRVLIPVTTAVRQCLLCSPHLSSPFTVTVTVTAGGVNNRRWYHHLLRGSLSSTSDLACQSTVSTVYGPPCSELNVVFYDVLEWLLASHLAFIVTTRMVMEVSNTSIGSIPGGMANIPSC